MSRRCRGVICWQHWTEAWTVGASVWSQILILNLEYTPGTDYRQGFLDFLGGQKLFGEGTRNMIGISITSGCNEVKHSLGFSSRLDQALLKCVGRGLASSFIAMQAELLAEPSFSTQQW